MIQYNSPILTDNSDPTSALVWTQCAGGQVDLLIANSNSESSSSLTGGDHIEKPPTLAKPGMKKSTHWPALKWIKVRKCCITGNDLKPSINNVLAFGIKDNLYNVITILIAKSMIDLA